MRIYERLARYLKEHPSCVCLAENFLPTRTYINEKFPGFFTPQYFCEYHTLRWLSEDDPSNIPGYVTSGFGYRESLKASCFALLDNSLGDQDIPPLPQINSWYVFQEFNLHCYDKLSGKIHDNWLPAMANAQRAWFIFYSSDTAQKHCIGVLCEDSSVLIFDSMLGIYRVELERFSEIMFFLLAGYYSASNIVSLEENLDNVSVYLFRHIARV